jgi:histidinol-phosphate/aromatic aminotransferase/cobyric acid decarboxylase-like protein
MPASALSRVVAAAPSHVRWWIDETYIEFVSESASLETMAAQSSNVMVCKSMSKVYALSGARAAYLVGPPALLGELRPFAPPWAVSLVGQMAACEALAATDYYRARWAETSTLRESLAASLRGLDWDVVPGCANFLLCHLPASAPSTAELLPVLRAQGLFLRDVSNMGTTLGDRTLRVAVKDSAINQRMVELISRACGRRVEQQLTCGPSVESLLRGES